jgi:hypothetical protein
VILAKPESINQLNKIHYEQIEVCHLLWDNYFFYFKIPEIIISLSIISFSKVKLSKLLGQNKNL